MKIIENIGICISPMYFRNKMTPEQMTPQEMATYNQKQSQIISLLIALYPIISSYYPEYSTCVVEPSLILSQNEVDEIMKNPFTFDYGDYDFESAKTFSDEYFTKFKHTPTLK